MIKLKKKSAARPSAEAQCPKCASEEFRRTTFRSNDPFMVRTFYKAYRCRKCRYRFFLINTLIVTWSSIIAALTVLMFGAWLLQQFAVPELEAQDIAAYNRAVDRAQGGDGAAELQVGVLLSEGRGVVRSDKEAAQWFKKSAQHGNLEGQYQYGNSLSKGIGVLQNYKEAINWIEKAARAGHVKAQYDLGNIYRYKSGVENDPKRAYLWFTLAAGQGSMEAAIARDQVEGRLKPEEIAALQEEAGKITVESR
ncbi:SEL1-like repeat protein [Methylovulum psychrotolerans]|uniref:Sel1 repeat family protein n=2 Tax=Methylovulum psychrotolerans TaxID=1704499 RepID=A0A1Z4C213_9GAMM|nr:SEL1-like repeat protein [Methylovulum psychrotolerans]ASF47571.1 hypothetical protein CEK71_16715 [Methylovulum psychrotolerans]MBT9099913.1 SEL1-like repeat protein [Methylovulum psychrotolerans]